MKSQYVVSPNTIVGEGHASTVVELPNGELLCAWFGGADEGNPETNIWMSRWSDGVWGAASMVATAEAACFNPVLFVDPNGVLWLYYKAGPDVPSWTGLSQSSTDGGATWVEPTFLPGGLYGPIKNKPITLSDGMIACGSSVECYETWTCWVYLLDPKSSKWSIHGPLSVPEEKFGVIQPTLWEVKPDHLRAFMRATAQIGRIVVADSFDGGRSWSDAASTSLPNNNSGIDAVKLSDGRTVLAYNHRLRNDPQDGRDQLHLAVSTDDGDTWGDPVLVEGDGLEFSYPAVIEGADDTVHLTYTWNRVGIKHVAYTVADVDRIAQGSAPE